MTQLVQEFIEENIDYIEESDWNTIIELWYELASSIFTCTDEQFEELANVLETAGINFMLQTEKTRKEFMSNLIDQILNDEVESARFRNTDEIKKADILMQVDCNLGFSEAGLDKIMEDVGENKYNLDPDFTCFYLR